MQNTPSLKTTLCLFVISGLAVFAAAAEKIPVSSSPSILLKPIDGKSGAEKLLLIVPVGPPADYVSLATAIQNQSALRLSVGLAVCSSHVPVFNITLCDPEFELEPVLKAIIDRANSTGVLLAGDVFVGGHSVGGACARRFVDTQYKGAGGVLFFGTQFTGDTENLLTGFLGYPEDLMSYTTPLLAVSGELDKFSIDNLALTVKQWMALPEPRRFQTYPVIIPGMDESSYSFPYQMSHDLVPEITQKQAIASTGKITGAWLDYVTTESASTNELDAFSNDTIALTSPFLAAYDMDRQWCEEMQKQLPGVPSDTEITVTKVPGIKLDSCHTKYELTAKGSLKLTLCDYTTYTYNNQPPWEAQYVGAKEISCKLIGEDRIAQIMKLPAPDMKADSVVNRCKSLNKQALATAETLVRQYWPKALQRFSDQGKHIVFSNDTQTYAGPQWLLEGFGYDETDTQISVQGTALVTTVKSLIYPGQHYCKLLSPSKAVDIVMTMGLTKRYALTNSSSGRKSST